MDNEDDEDEIMIARAVEESIHCYQTYVDTYIQEQQQQEQEEERQRHLQQQHLQQQQSEDYELAQALHLSLQHQTQTELHNLNNQLYNSTTSQIIQTNHEQNIGCWDCTTCTFTNQPYRPTCNMCHANAPSHILVYDNKCYSNIPFGVEIEIIIPNGKNDGLTYESIAHSLSNLSNDSVRYMGYTHETMNNWKIVTDASIQENNIDMDLCFELVSPVLCGEDGLSSLRNILCNIRKIGIATNGSCGFHVHVDAHENTNIYSDNDSGSDTGTGSNPPPVNPIATLDGLKRIAQHFVSLENAFDLIVARIGSSSGSGSGSAGSGDRRANNNRYCQSNRILFGQRSNRQRWDYIESIQSIHSLVHIMNPDRYRKLNMSNITKHNRPSTIEFRQHGGVEDIQTAEAWVRLVLSFCYHASTKSTIIDNDGNNSGVLPEYALPTDELDRLFDIINCQGLQQFFTLDRQLYHNQVLSNQWKCGVCHRVFKSSRSLSQHVAACRHY